MAFKASHPPLSHAVGSRRLQTGSCLWGARPKQQLAKGRAAFTEPRPHPYVAAAALCLPACLHVVSQLLLARSIVPNSAWSPQMWLSPSLHQGATEVRGLAVQEEPPCWCHMPVPILAQWGPPRCRLGVPGLGDPAAGVEQSPPPACTKRSHEGRVCLNRDRFNYFHYRK